MTGTVAQQVAARITELRKARGLSIRELARRAGLPPELVSRSERGLTEITLSSLAKLCAGLMLDLPAFFDFARSAPAPEVHSSDLRRAVEMLAAVAPGRRRRAIRGLELMLFDASPVGSGGALLAAEQSHPYSKRGATPRPATRKRK